jgi:hypothetical protein
MSWRTEQDGFIKTWAQDVRNSYKVRLKYVLIPKGVKTDFRFIDTPYRFQTYQEAREYAKELFPCYSYVVEGSPDNPNFNETQFVQRTSKGELLDAKYYDVYGVKRSYMKEPLDSREMSMATNTNKNKVKKMNKSTIQDGENSFYWKDEIEKRLADIEVLRLKLDEKEAELKRIKNSSKSSNTINPPPPYNSKQSNNSKKTSLPATIANSSKKSNTSKLSEQPPPY